MYTWNELADLKMYDHFLLLYPAVLVIVTVEDLDNVGCFLLFN